MAKPCFLSSWFPISLSPFYIFLFCPRKPHWVLNDHLCHSTITSIYMGGRTLQIQHCYSNKPYPMKNSAWFPTPSLPQSSENKWVLKAVFCFHPQLEWPGYVFVALWGFGLECGYREESCLDLESLCWGSKSGGGVEDLTCAFQTNQESRVLPYSPLTD